MNIRPFKTATDYQAVHKEIETLMHAAADTLTGNRLDVVVTLVEAYEAAHYPTRSARIRRKQSNSPWSRKDWGFLWKD